MIINRIIIIIIIIGIISIRGFVCGNAAIIGTEAVGAVRWGHQLSIE